jgi:hypothetical protein
MIATYSKFILAAVVLVALCGIVAYVKPWSNTSTIARDAQLPSCEIRTDVQTVTSLDEEIHFSWTSKNASVVNADYPVGPENIYTLPPNGSGYVRAKGGLSTAGAGYEIIFRFSVTDGKKSGYCYLTLPYSGKI